MNRHFVTMGLIAVPLVLVSIAAGLGEEAREKSSQFTSTFPVDKATLVSVGKNPYFILEPGYRLHFKAEHATLTVTVLDETKAVDGVKTRIVEERETEDGKLIEVSRNYFAIDKATGAVYYFGEDVDIYRGGKVVGHEGAWLSGVDGARFGMMMPGKPKVGDKFYQELAPKVAMDRCEVVAVGEGIKTPAGAFKDCLGTKETSPLERGASVKVYAPGVGMVRDDEFLLVRVERPPQGRTRTAMKGWELRIWQEKGDTYFSLLPGTNRLKTDGEITKASVKGIEAIKAKLDELKFEEMVIISGTRKTGSPPRDQANQVREYCKRIGLKVR